MSSAYKSVAWNRQKRVYDLTLLGLIVAYFAVFFGVSIGMDKGFDLGLLTIRSTAILAFVLLHFVLLIGPLCRINAMFLPLLYNRRHLGVVLFLVALVHGVMALMRYHGGTDVNPLVSLFTAYSTDYNVTLYEYRNLPHFPFEPLGFFALLILGLMAATSHDFWLKNLKPSTWKFLHMLVYFAWGLAVLHVALGILQDERDRTLVWLVSIGTGVVLLAHLLAYAGESRRDRRRVALDDDGFVDVCEVSSLQEGRGMSVNIGKERVAIFLHRGRVIALDNVCPHQGGPLGEGRIVDGFVTCPWHGRRFKPETGHACEGSHGSIGCYEAKIAGGTVYVKPQMLPAGTPARPVSVQGAE